MTEAVLAAVITGGLSLLGVIFSSVTTLRRMESQMMTAQAVTDTKLVELTREVREHNDFAHRVPVLEERMNTVNRRIADLEREQNNLG